MGQDALPLDGVDRRSRRGAARAAVERTLTAWRSDGHLEGPAFAAAVRVLRDSADAVDAAHAALDPHACAGCGRPIPGTYKGSPHTLAIANNIHAQLLAQAAPTTSAGPDPYAAGGTDDDALAAALAAALREDPAPPVDPGGLPAD